ncbi:hypothetical protein [Candidatus Pantoea multigeneris]|uniref:Flagellar FliJ protein n=1 Tax=Candidatus Pantoea multigeneris TaxID=2608357 RepID=A0ABX0RJ53_9GAMM|nr:hypothetical protein [Pantoea multigeneris]NIF23290.1 hypothetical protein [Pantoea multigeneris]
MDKQLSKLIKLRRLRVTILDRERHLLKKKLDDKIEERRKLKESIDEFSFIYRTYSDDIATKDVPLKSYKLSIQAMSAYRDMLLGEIRLNKTNIQHVVEEEKILVREINEVDKDIISVRKSEKKIEFLLEINNEND